MSLVRLEIFLMKHLIETGIIPSHLLSASQRSNGASRIDLSLVDSIREKSSDYLSNAELLESELLPSLGLNDERLYEFPEELYAFCGRGLQCWQYPNQFSEYLVVLSTLGIESYLELGVRHGGTFVTTVEYLNRFRPVRYALGVDICHSPSLVEYKDEINPEADFMRTDTQSPEFKEFVKDQERFDLVLIDGDHREVGCRNDFETVKGKANVVVFHDIASDVCQGVRKVWNGVRKYYSDEYVFLEFTDQYRSVTERTGHSFLGIGVAARRGFLQQKHALGWAQHASSRSGTVQAV